MKNKEQIYDETISPLMLQIIEICKKNGIAMVANFLVPNDVDGDVQALSHLPDGDGNFPNNHQAAVRAIRAVTRSLQIKSVDAAGKTTLTAFI